jgi:DNA-binding response OmpR family regulator
MAKTILLIDDDPQLVRVTQMLFEMEGYHVQVANSGEEALAALHEYRADLILLDLMMPGLDGLAVCREIRRDQKLTTVPVVVFTAAEGEEKALLEAGADRFVVKPFSLDGLRKVVSGLIGSESSAAPH